ncbi:MAG: hypothetical protein WC679_01890 [Bacteroidales bacterium]|jgi:hypothetical protein
MYIITKSFVSGSLKGLQHTEKTNVKFTIGPKIYGLHGSKYKIINVELA